MAKGMPDEVILDFSQVRPFEPMDSSLRYLCTVTALDISKSQAGKPKSHCELTVEAPEEVSVEEWAVDEDGRPTAPVGLADRTTRAKGRKLFREFSLETQALPFLYEFIKAVDPTAKLNETFKYNPNNYIGLQCVVSIQNEAFEEQVRARVQRMYPVSTWK
jgi:hypothetical protein